MPQFLSDLVLPRDPDTDLKAAPKQYVDAAGGGGGSTEVYAQDEFPVIDASVLWVDTDSVVTEGGGGVDEVAIQSGEPVSHPDLWVDLDDDTGTGSGGTGMASVFLLMGA